MQFGGFDKSFMKDDDPNREYGIHWFPLVGQTWWQMTIIDTQYDSKTIFSGLTKTCIMDTGTSLIAVPSKEFSKLIQSW